MERREEGGERFPWDEGDICVICGGGGVVKW